MGYLKGVLRRNLRWIPVLFVLTGMTGCECTKCRTVISPPATASCPTHAGVCRSVSNTLIPASPQERLTCPMSKDLIVVYTRDGNIDFNCIKCGIVKDSRPCLECRPPKATPGADGCLFTSTNL